MSHYAYDLYDLCLAQLCKHLKRFRILPWGYGDSSCLFDSELTMRVLVFDKDKTTSLNARFGIKKLLYLRLSSILDWSQIDLASWDHSQLICVTRRRTCLIVVCSCVCCAWSSCSSCARKPSKTLVCCSKSWSRSKDWGGACLLWKMQCLIAHHCQIFMVSELFTALRESSGHERDPSVPVGMREIQVCKCTSYWVTSCCSLLY